MNLLLLIFQQSHQVVVQLNRLQGLDVHRLPAGARSMHHALHAALPLRLDRNHKALAANRDHFVLHRAALGIPPQRGAQTLLNRPLLPFHLAPDAPQLGRSIVGQRPIRQNLLAHRLRQVSQARRQQLVRQRCQLRQTVPRILWRSPHQLRPASDLLSQRNDCPQLLRFERHALDPRLRQQIGRIEKRPQLRHHACRHQ